ncbi:P30 dbc protein, partial [Clonorchis sinensis]
VRTICYANLIGVDAWDFGGQLQPLVGALCNGFCNSSFLLSHIIRLGFQNMPHILQYSDAAEKCLFHYDMAPLRDYRSFGKRQTPFAKLYVRCEMQLIITFSIVILTLRRDATSISAAGRSVQNGRNLADYFSRTDKIPLGKRLHFLVTSFTKREALFIGGPCTGSANPCGHPRTMINIAFPNFKGYNDLDLPSYLEWICLMGTMFYRSAATKAFPDDERLVTTAKKRLISSCQTFLTCFPVFSNGMKSHTNAIDAKVEKELEVMRRRNKYLGIRHRCTRYWRQDYPMADIFRCRWLWEYIQLPQLQHKRAILRRNIWHVPNAFVDLFWQALRCNPFNPACTICASSPKGAQSVYWRRLHKKTILLTKRQRNRMQRIPPLSDSTSKCPNVLIEIRIQLKEATLFPDGTFHTSRRARRSLVVFVYRKFTTGDIQRNFIGSVDVAVISVDVEPCNREPWRLIRGTPVTVVIRFMALGRIYAGGSSIEGLFRDGPVRVPLQVNGVCAQLVPPCPIETGEVYTYEVSDRLPSNLPQASLKGLIVISSTFVRIPTDILSMRSMALKIWPLNYLFVINLPSTHACAVFAGSENNTYAEVFGLIE